MYVPALKSPHKQFFTETGSIVSLSRHATSLAHRRRMFRTSFFIHGLSDFFAKSRLANLKISASVGYENIWYIKAVAFIRVRIANEASGIISPALLPTMVA